MLTGVQVAELCGSAADVEVKVAPVDDAGFVAFLVDVAGLPRPVAELLASLGRAIHEGALDQQSTVVEQLTGRKSLSARAMLEGAVAAQDATRR